LIKTKVTLLEAAGGGGGGGPIDVWLDEVGGCGAILYDSC